MKYKFPVINTIEDVLPALEGHEEFIVMDKGEYKVIDYVMQSSATFPAVTEYSNNWKKLGPENAILRECRGLLFDKEGKLISRPFQKFFNYGEKPDEQKGLALPSEILEKLDGSMIRPLILDGKVRLATRKGITDVAMQAEEFIADKPNYTKFIEFNAGSTPIFEWCSRKNQIVIDHPEDTLILLAIRHNTSGEYTDYETLTKIAKEYNIPVVKSMLNDVTTLEEYVQDVRQLKDSEGVVMVWPDGHRMKAKAEWYVTLHRAKEAIGREKDLIKAYLTTGVDDILPILPEAYKQEVCAFLAKMTEELVTTCRRLDGIFVNIIKKLPDEFTKKQFALEVLKLDTKYKPFMFSMLPGTPCMEIVIPVLTRACSNRRALDEYRWLIGNIHFGDKTEETA